MKKVRKAANFVFRFADKMGSDRVRAHSAEAAFFIIMSFFPILMLLLTLIQYTPITQEQLIYTLEELTPFEVSGILDPIVKSLFNQSTALVSGTAIAAVWAAGKGIIGLSDGLDSIYRVEKQENYFAVRFRAACYTVVLILALIISIGILVFGYTLKDYSVEKFPFLKTYTDQLTKFPLLLAMLILVGLFAVLYAYLPGKRQKFLNQIPGAIFTSVSWAVFSYAFSLYLEFAGNMSVIYGSLTTLIVVMLWLYSCMYLLFIGAEINHYLVCPELF